MLAMGKKKGKKDADPVEPEHNPFWERVSLRCQMPMGSGVCNRTGVHCLWHPRGFHDDAVLKRPCARGQ